MTRVVTLSLAAMLVVGCAAQPDARSEPQVVRIVMAGDAMLGRAVGGIAEQAPDRIFAGVEAQLSAADLAAVNLESSLTNRPPVSGIAHDLRAVPGTARLLADAGVDLVSIANNHAGDAGPKGVVDTLAALTDSGVAAVGGGADADRAGAPVIRTVGGLSVGLLAFDTTGLGPEATASIPGVARWDDTNSPRAVERLRDRVDVLIVSIHGGAEYLPTVDASMRRISTMLADLDVDVVWGHGPHVVHDVTVADPEDRRPTVAASSLGNLVFDQTRVGTDRGALLEVMADEWGVAAFRVGETVIADGTVSFSSWSSPAGPAALVDGEWWSLTREPSLSEAADVDIVGFAGGDIVHAATGDVDLDGDPELVVSFRRPFRRAPLNELLRDVQWTDAAGRSAHLGVYDIEARTPMWVASALVRPVSRSVVCDGSVAVSYSMLDDVSITGTGGWVWSVFGWDEAPDLEGDRPIGCLDVDRDGLTEPVVGSPGPDET